MASSTDNVKLGVCTILFDNNDLGYTKGGVEVEVATTTHDVKVDQFGETPISELITGRTVTVKTPLAETTLENLVAIMPGSKLVSDGAKATGTISLTGDQIAEDDEVSINDAVFTFKSTPSADHEVEICATPEETAVKLTAAINAAKIDYTAEANNTVVTVTAKQRGTIDNGKISAVGAGLDTTDLTGGVDPTKAAAIVSTGVNMNLLDTAKTLVLRPIGTNGEDDFTVYRAACPGALNFAYQTDNERVYKADFKGYAREDGRLFSVGKE